MTETGCYYIKHSVHSPVTTLNLHLNWWLLVLVC